MSLRIPCLLLCLLLVACQPAAQDQSQVAPAEAATATTTEDSAENGARAAAASDVPAGQLSRAVRPEHYQLDLTIIPSETHFTGHVEIDLVLDEPTNRIFLHGQDMIVDLVSITPESGRAQKAEFTEASDSGLAEIRYETALSGKAKLNIDYRAPFNEALEALYRVEAGGEYYAFTQFEAISARLAFPGFDEPYFKVPFDVSIRARSEDTVIANAPEISVQEHPDGMKTVRFATTKPLPTYLVAFAVGPFDVVSWTDLPATSVREREVPLRGVAVKGKGPQLRYALEHTQGLLEAIESYFDIPYPYAKLDLIAVPDFNAGAMENPGAITYRESLLLIDDDTTPQRIRRHHIVHAHELAHQWFGNLVTPEWWSDIWLNESFATWMSYAALDLWRPEDGYRSDLAARGLGVMGSDTLVSARPIREPIETDADIAGSFNGITFRKGGAVLSMFEAALGRDAFRAGVRNYMEKHAWGTANSHDFVEAMSSAATVIPSEQAVSAFRSFLDQSGLPVVTASLDCAGESASITLSQQRFLPLGSPGSDPRQWEIPVCMRLGQGESVSTHCEWLTEPEQTFQLPEGQCPDYVMPNADSAGYYRWVLAADGWGPLLNNLAQLSHDEILSLSDSLDGAFNSGLIDVTTYMSVVPRLANHDYWRVSADPMGQLSFIRNRLASAEQLPALRKELGRIYSDKADSIGMGVKQDVDSSSLQNSVVSFLANHAADDAIRSELLELAKLFVGYDSEPGFYTDGLNSNLMGAALSVAVEELGEPMITHLDELLDTSDDPVIRARVLSAIGSNLDPSRTPELMAISLTPRVKDNEVFSIIGGQLGGPETKDAAWQWATENMDGIMERLPTWAKSRIVFLGGNECTPEGQANVRAFFSDKVAAYQGGEDALKRLMESIDLCVAKVGHHKPGFDDYIAPLMQ